MMAFCTTCGAETQGKFCVKCGSPAGAPAPAAAPAPAPAAPVKKKSRLLLWVLVGLMGFFLLLGAVVVGGVFFAVHKAKQAGLDPDLLERNPGLAVTKMLAAANPDIEVVRVDEAGGVITLREKSTGKTTTVNFEDIKRGRITFSSEGETMRLGGGADFKLPAWLPAYPGAKVQGNFSAGDSGKEAGLFSFTTRDSTTKVLDFYAGALKSSGLEITSRGEVVDEGGALEAEGGGRKMSAEVSRGDGGTSVSVTFEARK